MKLSFKIIGFIVLVILAIISLDGVITVFREINIFKKNKEDEIIVLGSIIKGLILEGLKNNGEERSFEIINNMNHIEQEDFVSLFWINNNHDKLLDLDLDKVKINLLLKGEKINIISIKDHTAVSYMPIFFDDGNKAVIKITMSLKNEEYFIKITLIKVLIFSLSLIIISIILVWLIGTLLIKNPLDLLGKKIKKISFGDFTINNVLNTKDELFDLEQAINQMCEKLQTSEKSIEKETKKRIEVLEQLSHAERLTTIGRIASGLAHEIGTPINIIKGRAQLILDEELEENEVKEYSKIIINETDRISKIIKQLLDYAKLKKTEYSHVNINDLIQLVINLLSTIAIKSNINIEFKKIPGSPDLDLDQIQFQQVLINLIVNAIDAMPDGGKINISTSVVKSDFVNNLEKEYFCIQVKDEGMGIPQNNIDKVFQPFFTTKEPGKGTGLGLSIIQNIVNSHNGYIKVDSELNKGTIFKIFIPLRKD